MYPRNPIKGITFFLDLITDKEKTSIRAFGAYAGTISVPVVSQFVLKTSDSLMCVLFILALELEHYCNWCYIIVVYPHDQE